MSAGLQLTAFLEGGLLQLETVRNDLFLSSASCTMPVRTRPKAPANRVYSSPIAQQQVTFKPRKKGIAASRSLGTGRPSRQETLTQMDFVNFQQPMDNDEEIYEEQPARKRRRRRTEGDAPSSTSKFHTQTLTQLEFVSTPGLRREGLSDDENDFRIPSSHQEDTKNPSDNQAMGRLKTPSRQRVYEVPSSQSPLSPTSVRSRRSLPTRSPLKALDINLLARGVSPACREATQRSPKVKLEIADTFEYESESQQSRVPQTPIDNLSPAKAIGSTVEPHPTISTQKAIKDEIQDSDEEDEGVEHYYNDLIQESQVISDAINPISSDTQEAEDQLQSTMLQFTQQLPVHSTPIAEAEASVPLPRPSQATTVSLSQHPNSSPFWPRQRNNTQHAKAMEGLDTQPGIDEVPINTDISPIVIPDSPSHQLIADVDLSLSPTLPRLRSEIKTQTQDTQNEAHRRSNSRTEVEDIPPPFSIASSQLLTRSQMLPESLMNDSVPPPPPRFWVEDSEEDD